MKNNILLCCPFNRMDNYELVLSQWMWQLHPSDLCIVSNDITQFKYTHRDVIYLESSPTIGAARNAGIRYARDYGYEWIAFIDDDNYYAPWYLKSLCFCRNDYDVISPGIGFVRFDDEGLYLFKSPLVFSPGHCTLVRTSAALEYPEQSGYEDVIWSERMVANGARFDHIHTWHLVYNRAGGGHAFDANKTRFMASFGKAQFVSGVPDNFVNKPKSMDGYPEVEVQDEDIFAILKEVRDGILQKEEKQNALHPT